VKTQHQSLQEMVSVGHWYANADGDFHQPVRPMPSRLLCEGLSSWDTSW
jgi:hypothetical protein